MASVMEVKTEDLDALVAEHVMGWFRHKGMMHGKPQDVFTDKNGLTWSVWCGCDEDFNPSADIRDSMRAIEKMQERGFRIAIRDYEGVVTWEVTITDPQKAEFTKSGNELPEVISRAMLAALSPLVCAT